MIRPRSLFVLIAMKNIQNVRRDLWFDMRTSWA